MDKLIAFAVVFIIALLLSVAFFFGFKYLRNRTEGTNNIWASASVDTSTADGVNDEYNRSARKFVIKVRVKVEVFSEIVELNFYNEDQSTDILINN